MRINCKSNKKWETEVSQNALMHSVPLFSGYNYLYLYMKQSDYVIRQSLKEILP